MNSALYLKKSSFFADIKTKVPVDGISAFIDVDMYILKEESVLLKIGSHRKSIRLSSLYGSLILLCHLGVTA
jgi:hypothetical protein